MLQIANETRNFRESHQMHLLHDICSFNFETHCREFTYRNVDWIFRFSHYSIDALNHMLHDTLHRIEYLKMSCKTVLSSQRLRFKWIFVWLFLSALHGNSSTRMHFEYFETYGAIELQFNRKFYHAYFSSKKKFFHVCSGIFPYGIFRDLIINDAPVVCLCFTYFKFWWHCTHMTYDFQHILGEQIIVFLPATRKEKRSKH